MLMLGQMGTPTPLSPGEQKKAEAELSATRTLVSYPQPVDITKSTGISIDPQSDPEARFIAESMSGGVAMIDYDGDGWPDIYSTNAQSLEMVQHGVRTHSALNHNNHDGTFTDVTEQGRRGVSLLGDGRGCGRLQQRRPTRLACNLPKRCSALSQQRRWHIYRCDQRKRTRQRYRLGYGRSVWRL